MWFSKTVLVASFALICTEIQQVSSFVPCSRLIGGCGGGIATGRGIIHPRIAAFVAESTSSDDEGESARDDVSSPPSEPEISTAIEDEADVSPSDVEQEDISGFRDEISIPLPTELPTEDDFQSEKDAFKTSLLLIASRSDRGQTASQDERAEALDIIQSMELLNTAAEPASLEEGASGESALGTWELIYSSTQLFRSSPFFMAGRAVCTTDDQARQYDWFCDMHRDALAISTIGKVRQIISATKMVSEFEVKVGAIPFLSDFTPFSYSGGWPVSITGSIVSSADITAIDYGTAWELFMDTVEIKGSNIPGVRQVLDNGLKLQSRMLGDFLEKNVEPYTNPRPIFRTTYLDDNIRISRDQDDKVFVYAKVSADTEPTDYRGTLSDLGVAGLLEGFNDAVTKFYI